MKVNFANNKHRGSSLIEVVVALFVLAIGMLGVLSLQVKSMQFNQSAYYYSQAVYLANDILEGMRSNSSAAETYLVAFDSVIAEPAADCEASGVTCTPAQLKNFNLYHWRQRISDSLVSGRSSITKVGDFFAITVQFDDSRSEIQDVNGAVINEYVLVTEI